ncbi:MAG: YezD family protein [Thermacetogeniaceae bacterium]
MGVGPLLIEREKEDLKAISGLPWIRGLLLLLKDLRYGSVTLVVQDGKVIQIEKVEKVRLC